MKRGKILPVAQNRRYCCVLKVVQMVVGHRQRPVRLAEQRARVEGLDGRLAIWVSEAGRRWGLLTCGTSQINARFPMNVWYRLGIPVIIGLAAAVFNFMAIIAKVQPQIYAALTRQVSKGFPISEGDFFPVKVCVDNADLARAAVHWEDRMVLANTRAAYDLKAGQVLLYSDVRALAISPPLDAEAYDLSLTREQARSLESVRIGDQVSFLLKVPGKVAPETLGRFLVLNLDSGDSGSGDRGRPVTLTVAVRTLPGTRTFEPKFARLIAADTRCSGEQIERILPHEGIEKDADVDEG